MSKTLGGAYNASGTDSAGQGCHGSSEKQLVVHVGLSKYRRYEGKHKEKSERMKVLDVIKERQPGKSDRRVKERKEGDIFFWMALERERFQVYIQAGKT